eukprot:scaffold23401_cov16-Tisochrysis_lutea.AAC.1
MSHFMTGKKGKGRDGCMNSKAAQLKPPLIFVDVLHDKWFANAQSELLRMCQRHGTRESQKSIAPGTNTPGT